MSEKVEVIIDGDSTKADKAFDSVTKKASKAEKEFEKLKKKEKKLEKQSKKTTKSTDKFSEALREGAASAAIFQGPLGPVAGRINALGSALRRANPLLLAATAGITAVLFVTKKASSAASSYESQMLTLNSVLKQTGRVNEFSAAQADEFAKKLGIDTLTSAKEARIAIGKFSTFLNVSNDVMKQGLILSQDLAANGFGTLTENATSLGFALDNPTQGISRLTRNGITFTNQQKEQIKVLQKSGKLLEAQGIIIQAVTNQVGGSGKAAAGGLAGATDTLGERWTQFLENVGQTDTVMKPALAILNNAAALIEKINRTFFLEQQKENLLSQIIDYAPLLHELGVQIDDINVNSIDALKTNLKLINENFANPAELLKTKRLERLNNELVLYKENLKKVVKAGQDSAPIEAVIDNVQKKIDRLSGTQSVTFDSSAIDDFVKNITESTKTSEQKVGENFQRLKNSIDLSAKGGEEAFMKLELAHQLFLDTIALKEAERGRIKEERRKQQVEARFASFEQQFLSESEIRRQQFELELEELRAFQDNKLISEEETKARRLTLEAIFQNDLAKIRKKGLIDNKKTTSKELSVQVNKFNQLNIASKTFGKAAIETTKEFALQEGRLLVNKAVVNAYEWGTKTLGGPIGGAIAALAAKTAGSVLLNNISSGGASAPPATTIGTVQPIQSQTTNIRQGSNVDLTVNFYNSDITNISDKEKFAIQIAPFLKDAIQDGFDSAVI